MKNPALRTLFIYNGIFAMAAAMLGPLYAIYVEKFVDGVGAISMSWAVFLITTSVFTYLVSAKGDNVEEREYLLLAGYIVRIISWISLIFVHDLWTLIMVQILLGIGESLGTPSFNALVAEHLDKNKFVKQYSAWSLISNLTAACGILIGGFIVGSYGFQALFLLMAGIAMISFFGVLVKPRSLL